jgi:hypothetical protein
MRGDHRRFGQGDNIPEKIVADVRDINHNAEPVHLLHDLFAQGT